MPNVFAIDDVFMTESPGTPDELRRRAKAFQIDDDVSSFPVNAEPIMNAVLSLYGPPPQPSPIVSRFRERRSGQTSTSLPSSSFPVR